MERKVANIDEFQVDENGIPLFPAGLLAPGDFSR